MRRTCGFRAGEVSARRQRIVKKMPAQVSWVQSKCGLCRAGVGLLVAGLEPALEAMLPSLVRLAGCRKRAHPAKHCLCRPCHIGFELRIVQEGRSRPACRRSCGAGGNEPRFHRGRVNGFDEAQKQL